MKMNTEGNWLIVATLCTLSLWITWGYSITTGNHIPWLVAFIATLASFYGYAKAPMY